MNRGKLRSNILLAIGSIVVMILILELVLRVSKPMLGGRTEPFSPYGARYLPNGIINNGESGDNCIDRTNNIGFHDRTFEFHIPDSVRRIAFFGDSFVEGAQVVADSLFFNVFEDVSNIDGWKVDAAGFGISGNGADQEVFRSLHVMQQVRLNDVVYVFFSNDFLDGHYYHIKPVSWPFLRIDPLQPISFSGDFQYEPHHSPLTELLRFAVNKSYLLSFISHRKSLIGQDTSIAMAFGTDEENVAIYAKADSLPPDHLAARNHWEDVVRYWRDLCALNKIHFHILYMPGKWEVDDSVYAEVFAGDVPQRGISTWVGQFCERNGINFLNASEYLAAAANHKGRELYWIHLNHRGHRLMGQYLHEAL